MRKLKLFTSWLALHSTLALFCYLQYGVEAWETASERAALHHPPQLRPRHELHQGGLSGVPRMVEWLESFLEARTREEQEKGRAVMLDRIGRSCQDPDSVPACVTAWAEKTHASPETTEQLLELWEMEKENGVSFQDFIARVSRFQNRGSVQAPSDPSWRPRPSHSRGTEDVASVTPDAEWMDWSKDGPRAAWIRQPPVCTSKECLRHAKVTPCSAGHGLTVEADTTESSMTTHAAPGELRKTTPREPYLLRRPSGAVEGIVHVYDNIKNKLSDKLGPHSDAIRNLYDQHNEDEALYEDYKEA
ncbi:hypothetical protein TGPRC2_203790 [Toxoplasma gondii TgCatPRC2]|uniref:Transmembrane protein n=1 Tax=Toxoplasma gondii TgCatPRC2 TaxID=1130821 RepID=A0A151HAQ0_TOXGO|nr:hypothetical protein TGPRC2_203790 [Toxoplasma gondii TgCatPRC2]